MSTEILELRFADLDCARLDGQGDLSVANINRVEKGLVMEECGIIDIERNFTDESESVFPVFVIIDPHPLGDEAPKRVERKPANRSLDPAFVQLLNHQTTPLPAKAFLG